MRTVDDFAALRRAHRDGFSIRQIAKQFGVSRDTVRKALANPEPKPYALTQPRPAPTFGCPFRKCHPAIVRSVSCDAVGSNCQMLWTAAASGGFGLLHPIDKPNPGDDLR
jgi:hypothetical protein